VTTTLELRAGPARLTLAPEIGGAIAAYEWSDKPILRPTPEGALGAGDVRLFSSYPLIPFSNRIADAMLHWGGTAYPLQRYLPGESHAIHGNGWRRAWSVVERASTRATLELVHDAAGDTAREWPFPYRARQAFQLAADALTLTLTISNTGGAAFPFGLGWHPFFPRNAATILGFVAGGVWQTHPTLLPTRLDPVPSAWHFSAPRQIAATTLDNCFAGWQPPATLCWPDRDLSAAISADATCDYLVVFIPPGRDFLAVEPVTHMTDAFNRAAAGQPDTGTRLLAPGATFSCTMRISVSPGRGSTDAFAV
jgi:aldose 1-epimerase